EGNGRLLFEQTLRWTRRVLSATRRIHRTRYRRSRRDIAITVDDLFSVPEFEGWLRSPQSDVKGLEPPRDPKPSNDKRKDEENLSKYRALIAKEMSFTISSTNRTYPAVWLGSLVRYMDKKYPNLHYKWNLDLAVANYIDVTNQGAPRLAAKYTVSVLRTSLSGEAEHPELPAGTYWISNVVPLQFVGGLIQWNVKVVVQPQKRTEVELSK